MIFERVSSLVRARLYSPGDLVRDTKALIVTPTEGKPIQEKGGQESKGESRADVKRIGVKDIETSEYDPSTSEYVLGVSSEGNQPLAHDLPKFIK